MVAAFIVKLACELPDRLGRSLSTWTCAELAREVRRSGVVEAISPQTVQRVLASHKLKPWRVHYWLTPKLPRDETFRERVEDICDLYCRAATPSERTLCLDEMTSIQPRRRTAATRPARKGNRPVQLEHEYVRCGALTLFAAFDVHSGQTLGLCRRRKRQAEFIELLELIDRDTPADVVRIHLVCDNVSTHHGKLTRAWLAAHPRFVMHYTPVHCSWMNQVEQWFSILKAKRLRAPNFDNLHDLETKLLAFIAQWNEVAEPFAWTRESFRKALAPTTAALRPAA